MNTNPIDRVYTRLAAFRDKSAVSALLGFWENGADDFRGRDFPRSLIKYDGQFPQHSFSPCGEISGFLTFHAEDQSLKELVIRSLAAAAKDLSPELEKHGFRNTFSSPEIYWMNSLMLAGMYRLLGAEGIVGNTILRVTKTGDCTIDERMVFDERFGFIADEFHSRKFVQLANIVESSLMFLGHLSSEPRASTAKKKRGDTTKDRLKHLWETEKSFCIANSIDAIAAKIDRTKGTVSDSSYWRKTIAPAKKVFGTNGKHLKRIKKAINAGERISEQDEQLYNACDEFVRWELT